MDYRFLARQEVAPALPVTTIVPFADLGKLPACAINCGNLYDANGACVPTTGVATETAKYTSCFCAHSTVTAFSTGIAGVCDGICDPAGMTSIMNWYQSMCNVKKDTGGNDSGDSNNGDSNSGNGDSGSDGGSDNSDGGSSKPGKIAGASDGDWLSNHWQWVVMLVVLVVVIAGVWVGACIWRRRYLRKRDRSSTLSNKPASAPANPSWGPGTAPSVVSGASGVNQPGVFMPGSAAPSPYQEKSRGGLKKWIVNERT